jgi:predicted ester cyclase
MAPEKDGLVQRIFEQGLNQRQYEVWDELFAPTFVAHSALLGEMHGVEALKGTFATFVASAPDFHATIEDVVSGGDKIVVRVTYRGTDQGGFFERPATGKSFVLTAIYLMRLVEGRVVELWQEADRLGMMQQLGAIPHPTPSRT